jgi:GNAT superfamily N-acetyltransferase
MVSFNLEEAIQLRNLLQRFREVHHHEWSLVRQRWEDLKYNWQDVHCSDFEQDFQKIIHDQDDILENIERQLQRLERSILIIERMNTELSICGSSYGITGSQQLREQFLASNIAPPSQSATATSTSPETDSNSPNIPQTSKKKFSDFAMNLKFEHWRHVEGAYRFNPSNEESFNQGDNGKIEAVGPDKREIQCYISYVVDDQNRVKISNTDVSKLYRRQGIASRLFEDLEKRFPSGTTFFFKENQEEEFWKSVGFQMNCETNEYYYVKK